MAVVTGQVALVALTGIDRPRRIGRVVESRAPSRSGWTRDTRAVVHRAAQTMRVAAGSVGQRRKSRVAYTTARTGSSRAKEKSPALGCGDAQRPYVMSAAARLEYHRGHGQCDDRALPHGHSVCDGSTIAAGLGWRGVGWVREVEELEHRVGVGIAPSERRQVEPSLDETQDRGVVVDRVRDEVFFENGEIATMGTRMP